ncbi:hypothetical protein CC1G_10578 [Coprinopsis cinerea okayama7|uniref:Uncharacterized protein n=1 Tax=Coprinopsis cinerea (strain Okayama-7 / 130 / ATCC MYA-4618 / FGSC 9003) TaxID=240176 RepID=A8NDZ2_COPC7|nr:hypothetical protein CC1G_10578 [Coprinopsis cinerea okayama7\|eukprot:XP_001832902.1 hypothetical protein CC1G_10578 [Coprinopsis cinerea okayama7\
MIFTHKLAVLVPFIASASAICPGFNYGVGNVRSLGNGFNRWDVYNSACEVVDGLTTNLNPCDTSTFGCTPPPIKFNRYTNSFDGLIYECRPDPNSGRCGDDVISVCCRNDGG